MTNQPLQYAVLLNGRLVANTPFVFEYRSDVERLVRAFGRFNRGQGIGRYNAAGRSRTRRLLTLIW